MSREYGVSALQIGFVNNRLQAIARAPYVAPSDVYAEILLFVVREHELL